MSNSQVGEVYSSIIKRVIDDSQIDFEEAGIASSTLEELRLVWQQKLSALKVAQLPWDPPLEQTLDNGGTPPLPPQHQLQHPHSQQYAAHIKSEPGNSDIAQYSQQQTGGVRIKPEPGTEPQGLYAVMQPAIGGPPVGNPTHDPQLAQMRAQQLLAQRSQTQHQRPTGLVLPGMSQMPSQQVPPQQRPQQQHRNGIPQHDGTNDYDGIPVEGYGTLTRQQADSILLRRLQDADRQSAMSTIDLGVALREFATADEKGKAKASRTRHKPMDAYEATLDASTNYPYPSEPLSRVPGSVLSTSASVPPQITMQMDATDDDEDAINSDLDDPDDDEIDDDEDEDNPQIMLCMYDKVQRTKNKWKCVLKDGVLTINNKEYVFHKANGEYEW